MANPGLFHPRTKSGKLLESRISKHKKSKTLSKRIKPKDIKRSKSKSKSDRSRSHSKSGTDEKLEDEYIVDRVLGKRTNIFSDLDLKCNSHGITFSGEDNALINNTLKSLSQTKKKKGF